MDNIKQNKDCLISENNVETPLVDINNNQKENFDDVPPEVLNNITTPQKVPKEHKLKKKSNCISTKTLKILLCLIIFVNFVPFICAFIEVILRGKYDCPYNGLLVFEIIIYFFIIIFSVILFVYRKDNNNKLASCSIGLFGLSTVSLIISFIYEIYNYYFQSYEKDCSQDLINNIIVFRIISILAVFGVDIITSLFSCCVDCRYII